MPDIITAGEILVEVMTQKIDQTFLEPGALIGPFASGAPAIFIDQAAQMGASCGMISIVGDDDFGRLNVQRLQRDGVDVSQIKVSQEHTTGTAFVTYFEDGSRQFIYHFKDAAPGHMRKEDVSESYLAGCKYFHVMGCSLSATDGMRESVLKAARAAKAHGAKISFDPNLRVELLSNEKVRAVFDEMLQMTDILLTGESEIKILLGKDDLGQILSELNHVGIVILKNGSKGIKVLADGMEKHFPPYSVEEVDPTGAGDCFDGAFLACLADGRSVEDAARIANAAGALSVTKKGPMEGVHPREAVLSLAQA